MSMMDASAYPKLLVLSNNCLSNTDSNGRTLQNFLIGWPKVRIAQFYLQNSYPDFTVCERFYRVTDSQAAKAFLRKKPACGGEIREQKREAPGGGSSRKRKVRNAMTMLLREMVWNSRRWMTGDFINWVERFDPELILLQAGDCGFMLKLARDLAQKYQIPLVIYNSEVYYFKEHNYFRAKGIGGWVYPVFRRYFRSQLRKTLPHAHCSIYCCEAIQKRYDEEFSLPSQTIYTATTVTALDRYTPNADFVASYLGNLGVGRHEALVEIANLLYGIDERCRLDVYGKIPNDTVEKALRECPGICYKGFVSYDEVRQVMESSDLIIHAENFSEFYQKDSQYAFSTKIADSLASGRCFLLYAPQGAACYQYLKDNKAAYVAHDRQTLQSALEALVKNPDARTRYIENAKRLVEKNHCADVNTVKFQSILRDAVTGEHR